jgi:4-amino-4-deoxy-L-arabinose transferase-like glycosyltransferase
MDSPAFGGATGGASARRGPTALGWCLAAAALILAIAAVTLHRLDAAEVCGANEAIEGIFVQQMVEHGVMLFPLENGNSPMYKPPLFHWSATALDRLGGVRKVTAFNLRLPSALYAIAGVALTIGFASTTLGESGAILAGLVLAGSYQYMSEARIGRVDMALCFFETLALMSCLWMLPATRAAPSDAPARADARGAARSGEVGLRYLFALALGLGVLAKGPVAIILPLGAIGVFLMRERRLGELWELFTPGSVFVAIIVSLSWYVACAVGRRYGFLGRQLESENIGRFFGALGSMPPWYYVKPLLLNSAPLSLLVPFAVAAALTFYGPLPLSEGRARERSSDRASFAARLFATFWLVTVVFFSIAAYKRRAYLLPLWPASAFLLAWGADVLARRGGWGRIARGALGAVCVAMVVFNFFYLPRHERAGCIGGSYEAAAARINRVVGGDEPLYLYGFEEDPAALLFYLDRTAPLIGGKLGDAPPGYVIVPAQVWARDRGQALDLTPVLTIEAGGDSFLLLRHGPAIAFGIG